MEGDKTRLRPIVYTTSYFKRGYQNTTQQMLMLKALQITQDPEKLKVMMKMRNVAEVYRTIDKLAIRKEYHKALEDLGISFNYIASGIKGIADTGEKDADRLKAFQTLLKSVGLDKYDSESTGSSGTWEEELLKSIESTKNKEGVAQLPAPIQYEVKQPVIPESARKAKEQEDEMTSSIYENKK